MASGQTVFRGVARLSTSSPRRKEGRKEAISVPFKDVHFWFYSPCSLVANSILAQIKAGETAAVIARELAEQTKRNLQAGDITYTVKAMVQLVDLLDVQLRNLTPGGKDSAARSLNKVRRRRRRGVRGTWLIRAAHAAFNDTW